MNNGFKTIEEFLSQYVGIWDPSNNHWLGLDFAYDGKEYRFHTGDMYLLNDTNSNENQIKFGLYVKSNGKYVLLYESESMQNIIESKVIDGKSFKEIITSENTILQGQD